MNILPPSAPALKSLRIAPDVASCPKCGTPAPRNEVRRITREAASLSTPTTVAIDVGCYLCPDCPAGHRWFRLEPAGFAGIRRYTDSTRAIVTSLVTRHKLSFVGAAAMAREIFHLPELADSTVLRWFREEGDQVCYRTHIEQMATIFSGQLAMDEIYDGNVYVIRVTDPLNGLEITCWMGEGSPTAADIREVLLEMKRAGIAPLLVSTDGSPLYPRVLAEVFPEATHQRCVFHFMQGVNEALGKAFWASYATMPEPKKRKRGRPKKRGRPREDNRKRTDREAVRACRFLVFKRGGVDVHGKPRFSTRETEVLEAGMRLCPALRELRRFVGAIHELVGKTTTTHDLAGSRRRAILADEGFRTLAGANVFLGQLAHDDLFARLTRHLDFENADPTSNHAERENREFRKRQGSRYRLRSVVSLCAFLDLMLVRRPKPTTPRRLIRRQTPAGGQGVEVLAA